MKKKILKLMSVFIVVFVLGISLVGCSSTKKYVGSNSDYDVTIELEESNYTLTVTDLRTNRVMTETGVYELVGSNKSVIRFKRDNGTSYNCNIMTNIYGTPFIAIYDEYFDLPACYLQQNYEVIIFKSH